MMGQEEVLRRARKRLKEVGDCALRPIAPLKCEAWLSEAPLEFGERASGRHVELEEDGNWPRDGLRHAWLKLSGDAGQAGPEERLVVRLSVAGDVALVDGEGEPVRAPSAGGTPDDGAIELEEGGQVELWLSAECAPDGAPPEADFKNPPALACARRQNLAQLYYDMEALIDLADALGDGSRRDMIVRALQRALSVLTSLNEERALAAIYALGPELERTSGDYGFELSAVGRLSARGDGRRFARLAAAALGLMDESDEYAAGAGGALEYDWLDGHAPRLAGRVRERVNQGRWEVQGALWAEPDMRRSGGELIARAILMGKRYYARAFGLDVNALWLMDSPACPAQLPQLMRLSGIQYLICGRAARPESWEFPHTSFWLQGQDGSRVLAHVPGEGGGALPARVKAVERGCREVGLAQGALMLCGAQGECPGRAQLERLERMGGLRSLAPVRRERAIDFMDRLRRSRVELPWWSGELQAGGSAAELTLDVRARRLERELERALRTAEMALTALKLRGVDYPRAELGEIWREAIALRARAADASAPAALLERLRALADASLGEERALDVVLNPHAWTLDMWLSGGADCGPDEGVRVSLPPMSASSTIGARRVQLPARRADERALENDRLRIAFDERGRLASVYDKRQNWEALRGAGNQLNVYAGMDAPPESGLARRVGAFVQLEARGEVDGPICRRTARYSFGESTMEQTVEISAGSARVDFITRIAWREQDRLLKAEFPLNVSAGRFRCDAPFGSVERPAHRNTAREWAQAELGALNWADLSQTGRGAALMLDGGYGYGCLDNVLSASLARSSDGRGAPDEIELRYALYPHAGDVVDATRQAYAFQQPPLAAQGPTFGPLCWVDARNVVLETVKLAEDSRDVVLRMYECAGASCSARLRTGFEARGASVCDILERVTAPLSVDGEAIELEFAPYEIKTVAITPR